MNLDARITYLGLRAFNFCYDAGAFIGNAVKQGLYDFSAYLGGRYNEWHFLEGEIGPLPDSVVRNRSIANIEWTYNTATHTLTHSHPRGLQTISSHPWLTASIRFGNIEYDADEFITKFQWTSYANIVPSRKVILYAWSIHTGIWFSERDNPILRVITFEGEQVDIPIFGESDDWERLIYGDESESESMADTDSESDIASDASASGNADDTNVDSESSDSNEESSDSNQESSDSNQESSDSNEESSDSNEESSDSNQESSDSNQEAQNNLPASPENINRNRIDSDNVEVIDAPVSST